MLAVMLAALVFAGLSPVAAQAADGPQFTVSPSSGRPGDPIHLSAVDLCPPIPDGIGDMPYQDVVMNFTDAAGVSSGDVNLGGIGEGAWDAQPFFPSPHFPPPTFDATKLTPEPALGMGSLHVRCVLSNGVVSQEYAPQPFNVTGEARRFTVSSSVEPGGTVHVQSLDPCPQPQDRIQLSVFNDQYANNLNVTPGSDGQWSADIPASYDDMGNIIPFKSGPIGLSANCTTDATSQTSFVYASVLSTVAGGGSGSACSDTLFLAVTGSGEHYDGDINLNVSPSLKKVYTGFRAVYPTDKTIAVKVIDYPALPVETLFSYTGDWPNRARQLFLGNLYDYLSGKDDGANALYHAMVKSKEDCGDRPIVLVGYSQGALIVHQVLQKLAKIDDPVQSAVKAAVLIADPMRTPNSEVVNFGDAPTDSKGVCKLGTDFVDICASEGVRDVPGRFQKMTTAVCNHYDAVCDSTSLIADMWPLGIQAKDTGIMVHTTYAADKMTKLAGRRAARQVIK